MDFSILSELLPNMAPTNSSNSNNQTEGITILCIISELILIRIFFLDDRWTGNGFELYDRISRQGQEAQESYSGLRKYCDIDPEVIKASILGE